MRLPSFRVRSLMVAVAVVALALAVMVQAAAGNPTVIAGMILAVVFSIAWIPAVLAFLPLVVARRAFALACLALLVSMTFAAFKSISLVYSVLPLWLTFASGLGFLLAWARRDFRRPLTPLRLNSPGER